MNIKSAFIRKRNDNYNVYIEYIDEEGKTKQKSQGRYNNKKDAEKHLIDLKSSINNNNYIINNTTFIDRCYKYLNDPSKKLSPATLHIRKSIMKTTVEVFFKDIKLTDVSPSILQGYANYVSENFTKSSAQYRLSIVKTVLNEAYRLKEINENPVNFIKMPRATKKDKQINEPYNRDEVKYLISNLEGSFIEIPILLMLTCGLRFSEMAGLRWQDINFKENTISINQVLIYGINGLEFKEPKTDNSIREISAPVELMQKLKKWKIKHNQYRLSDVLEYDDIVCLNSKLNIWYESSLLCTFKRFLKKINLREVRLHDLRHTHATLLVLSGTDFKTISNRLGHTDIKITLNRYSHVLKEMDHKASKNISNIMFK